VFELNDRIVEDIIFAMEDQGHDMVIDLESGQVVPLGAVEAEDADEGLDEGLADGASPDRYVSPPGWTSREGFKLMEGFLALVRQPTIRRELQAALSKGRGVFKNFKAALAEHEDIERAFRDYKTKHMGRVIASWYDDLREAQGLARLGPEPEDTRDLLASDFEIRLAPLAESRTVALELLRAAAEEALASLPAPLVEYEESRLADELEGGREGLCAVIDDGEGGALGAAVAFKLRAAERGLGRVAFLWVREGFRRIGLGRALLEAIAKSLEAEGIAVILVDSGLLPAGYGGRLPSLGYSAYGTRAFARTE